MKSEKNLNISIGWWSAAGAAAAVLAMILGIVLITRAFYRANLELEDAYNSHLLDIAWATDRNVAALLERTQTELGYAIRRIGPQESDYLARGGTEEFLTALRDIPLLETEYISELLVIRDGTILLCTENGERCGFAFPWGFTAEEPCLCEGEGKSYLAIPERSDFSELYYAALIDLDEFYGKLVGRDVTDAYWLLLYDEGTGLFLQNDQDLPETVRLPREEALARKDGYGIVAESEMTGQIITRRYRITLKDEEPEIDVLLSVVPSVAGTNGVFAVGVAVEGSRTTALLRSIAWNVLYSGILLAFGLVILLLIIIGNRRRNDELREQNENMQQLLDATRELAHHQRLEMIGTMTSSIAHEFNNLLTPIMGYSILTMEKLPEGNDELYDNLSEIYDASRRAKSLISRLSALSRKGSTSEATAFSPDALLDKVEEMALPAKPKNVVLIKEYHCPERCLTANETQIGQLLLNLIINAFQAMEPDGGTLTVSTARRDGQVIFRVADTGPGIEPELLPRIYDPFFTTKEMGRGTGLGLAIVHQIVDEHKGEISVESAPGKGTAFTISLPENRKNENPNRD